MNWTWRGRGKGEGEGGGAGAERGDHGGADQEAEGIGRIEEVEGEKEIEVEGIKMEVTNCGYSCETNQYL